MFNLPENPDLFWSNTVEILKVLGWVVGYLLFGMCLGFIVSAIKKSIWGFISHSPGQATEPQIIIGSLTVAWPAIIFISIVVGLFDIIFLLPPCLFELIMKEQEEFPPKGCNPNKE